LVLLTLELTSFIKVRPDIGWFFNSARGIQFKSHVMTQALDHYYKNSIQSIRHYFVYH
jgi:hypothetical protein